MTFAELQEEVIMHRFDMHQRESVGMWINHRYAQVNAGSEWPWRYPTRMSVAWGAVDETATVDRSANILNVYDSTGHELTWLPFARFEELFLLDPQGSPPATHWSIEATGADRLLHVRPLPGEVTLELVVAATPMMLEADTDEPVWPEEFHYALVLGATATGLKLENDPTWEPLEMEFAVQIAAMKEQVLPADAVGVRQYGRDMLGYEDTTWQ